MSTIDDWLERLRYLPRFAKLTAAKLGMPLTSNDRALNALSGIHEGREAVVIGMGPSLRPEDLQRLEGFVTFGCNKLYLALDTMSWRPDYYSVNDLLVAQNNQEEILSLDLQAGKAIHNRTVWNELRNQDGALFYDYRNSLTRKTARMPTRLGAGILTGGYSVCVEMVQLAYAMGCTEVYLIGIDFSFDVPKERTGEVCVSGEVLVSEGEVNHFHPDYRKPGETWTVPKMEEQRRAFEVCRRLFERDGRRLINASRTTKLDVLERADFDEVFPAKVAADA